MSPLHQFGESIRNLLLSVPLPAVRALFVLTLVALLIWVLRLPESRTCPPGGARRWDENLKWTACLAILIQIIIYSIF
ncbi:MAG: hypothetical protein NXI32_15190 [bacterium]|nr:hypothetical protein [bacterium]